MTINIHEEKLKAEIDERLDSGRYPIFTLEREYRFHPSRRWRFDFAIPEHMVAIEIEGGTWARGRHTRGDGYEKDCEKYNTAAFLGWRVFRFTTGMVEDGRAIATLDELYPPF